MVGVNLDHTNGCVGADPLFNFVLNKKSGRNYPQYALDHLRGEVKSGRYSTYDVVDCLNGKGLKDVTQLEARNLRFRLLKDIPIKGCRVPTPEESGNIVDFLHNTYIAEEFVAGDKKIVISLRTMHKGLAKQERGYDYTITADDQKRFAGTAWQSGRMRGRARQDAIMIVVGDSRTGINTSGFCFWNIMILNADRKAHTILGAMTMDPTDDA